MRLEYHYTSKVLSTTKCVNSVINTSAQLQTISVFNFQHPPFSSEGYQITSLRNSPYSANFN